MRPVPRLVYSLAVFHSIDNCELSAHNRMAVPVGLGYLFLEAAILLFLLGFCWERLNGAELLSSRFLLPACGLALIWFCIALVAIALDLWTFPVGGSSRWRFSQLPLEEYALFFIHTLMCYLLLRTYESR